MIIAAMELNPKYRGRARAAVWSKSILATAAVLSVLILPFSFDLESAVVVAGILTVTYFEFRVHRYFSQGDARAPGLGFRNQSCFAAGILVYGLYHAAVPTPIPPEYRNLLDEPGLGVDPKHDQKRLSGRRHRRRHLAVCPRVVLPPRESRLTEQESGQKADSKTANSPLTDSFMTGFRAQFVKALQNSTD